MRKGIIIAALAAAGTIVCNAQTPGEPAGPDLTGEMESAPLNGTPAQPPVGDNGQAEWYVWMDYADFEFELPSGLLVDKGPRFLAKSQDGSFGVSMTNEHREGVNQKIAYEIARRMATELNVTDAKVNKVKYGKCSGACATGSLEGSDVTLLVLPYGDEQVTAVILSAPSHRNWTDHFLQTLKR